MPRGLEVGEELSSVFTDTHAHLGHVLSRLGQAPVDALLESFGRAWTAESSRGREDLAPFILDMGVDPGDLGPRLEGFGRYPFIRFAAGLWPGRESLERPGEALAALERDIGTRACVALGECGLDYHHMEAPREEQIRLFEPQVEMAARFGLPIIVHSREAFDDTLAVLSGAAEKIPVVIHCFGYGPTEAERFLEEGCLISFAGNLGYGKSEGLRSALSIVPIGSLLMETDSPYMNPMPRRGKPSTPLDIARTISLAAELRSMPVGEFSAAVQANAFRIFSGGRRPASGAQV